jgi:hypothetical protein
MRHHMLSLIVLSAVPGCYDGLAFAETDGSSGGAADTTGASDTTDAATEAGIESDLGLCSPGVGVACYEGPPATLGVGACAAGVRMCGMDGRLGACDGAIEPTRENCATDADEDCNGTSACGGFIETKLTIGGDSVESMAASGQHLYVVWRSELGTSLGRFPFDGVAAVELEAGLSGDPIFIDVDASGDVVLGTTARAGLLPMDPDDGCAAVGEDGDLMIARYDSDLQLRERRCFGDERMQRLTSLEVDDDGLVLLGGIYEGSLGLPPGPVLPAAPDHALAFAVRIDAAFERTLWRQGLDLGALSIEEGPSLVAAPDGATLVYGSVHGGFDSDGGADLFINAYGPDGADLWASRLGNPADQRALAIGVGVGGHIWIAAETEGQIDVGGEPVGDNAESLLFVARLDPTSGSVLASRHVAGPRLASPTGGHALAVGASGELTLAGSAYAAFDFGLGAVPGAGGSDAFITKLSPAAVQLWRHRLGDEHNQSGVLVIPAPAGGLLYAGQFVGRMAFSRNVLESEVSTVFVLHYGD